MTTRRALAILLLLLTALATWAVWRSRGPARLVEETALVERLFPGPEGAVAVLASQSRRGAAGDDEVTYQLLAFGPGGRLRWQVPLPGLAAALPGGLDWAGGELWYLAREPRPALRRVSAAGVAETVALPAPLARPELRLESFSLAPDGRRAVLYTRLPDRKRWLQLLAAAPISAQGRARYERLGAPNSGEYALIWLWERDKGLKLVDLAWPGVRVDELGYPDRILIWSPDGKHLALAQGNSSGVELIGLVDTGGGFRVLARSAMYALEVPLWSRDGSALYVAEVAPERFWRHDVAAAGAGRAPVPPARFRLLALEQAPGLLLETTGGPPDTTRTARAVLYRDPGGAAAAVRAEADWQAHLASGRVTSQPLFEAEELHDVRVGPDARWAVAVLLSEGGKRQQVCRVQLEPAARPECLLEVGAAAATPPAAASPAALMDATVTSRLVAPGVRHETGVVGPYRVTGVTLDPSRAALAPAFADGRRWVGAAELRRRPGFLMAASGPPAGSGPAGRVAGDLFDGARVYRSPPGSGLAALTARRYHLRILADGTPRFGRGNFAGTWGDRAFVGGLGALITPQGGAAAALNDPLLWRAARGDHPAARVAIGRLPDGRLALLLVRGRERPESGPTLPQLARWLARRGWTEAYFLDGGSAALLEGVAGPSRGGRSFVGVYGLSAGS